MNAGLILVRSGLPLVRCSDGDGDGGAPKADMESVKHPNTIIAIVDFFI
jgi:hypothetical protein